MNAVVLGNGRSGKSAAALLRDEGAGVVVLDGADAWPADAAFDLCVTSPGVPLGHPWQRAARSRGVPVVSELQLGAERWRARGGRMLAVTGSKGKSSVVKLVADALGGVPCGNYGVPLCEVVRDRADAPAGSLPWAVVEVSSFQMETTALPPDAFEAAAVLNLQEDHLDRHGSAVVYHGLKLALLGMAKSAVRGDALPDAGADGEAALFAGSYFDNPVLRANGRCAVRLLRAAGLGDAAVAAAFARFESLPHRMQTVGVFGGVEYVDDSKATSLAALDAGVAMAAARRAGADGPRVRLIAGGLPKGDDPLSVIPRLLSEVKKVYLIGRCANQLLQAWKDAVPCEVCGTLDRAVAAVRRDAMPGEAVLLSPGAASFDQFKSYGVRGDAFRSLVCSGADARGADSSK